MTSAENLRPTSSPFDSGLAALGSADLSRAGSDGGSSATEEVESVCDLSHSVRTVNNVHVVSLRGALDIATAEGLADWLVGVGGSTVVMDLSALSLMDCSGIAVMVVAHNRLRERGDDLVLTRPQPIVRRALDVVGMSHWLANWDQQWTQTQ